MASVATEMHVNVTFMCTLPVLFKIFIIIFLSLSCYVCSAFPIMFPPPMSDVEWSDKGK